MKTEKALTHVKISEIIFMVGCFAGSCGVSKLDRSVEIDKLLEELNCESTGRGGSGRVVWDTARNKHH